MKHPVSVALLNGFICALDNLGLSPETVHRIIEASATKTRQLLDGKEVDGHLLSDYKEDDRNFDFVSYKGDKNA